MLEGKERKNCHDLLGWVRDMALARQKYTHQIMIYFLDIFILIRPKKNYTNEIRQN